MSRKNHPTIEGFSGEKFTSVPCEQCKHSGLSRDVLASYYETISKTPRLSPGEEIQMAKNIETARKRVTAAAKRHRAKQRPVDREQLSAAQAELEAVKTRFVEANLRLVVNVAGRYQHRGLQIYDLINEFSLSRERIRQIQNEGIKKMRQRTWHRRLDFVDE